MVGDVRMVTDSIGDEIDLLFENFQGEFLKERLVLEYDLVECMKEVPYGRYAAVLINQYAAMRRVLQVFNDMKPGDAEMYRQCYPSSTTPRWYGEDFSLNEQYNL